MSPRTLSKKAYSRAVSRSLSNRPLLLRERSAGCRFTEASPIAFLLPRGWRKDGARDSNSNLNVTLIYELASQAFVGALDLAHFYLHNSHVTHGSMLARPSAPHLSADGPYPIQCPSSCASPEMPSPHVEFGQQQVGVGLDGAKARAELGGLPVSDARVVQSGSDEDVGIGLGLDCETNVALDGVLMPCH